MRIDLLRRWAPEPGRAVRIQPTGAALGAAAGAPVSSGSPSFLQQDHLDAYRRTTAVGGTHRAWTGTASHQSGALDADALARALGRFVSRHEGLRSWFDLSGPETVRRLVAADDVAFEAVEVTGPADARAEDSERAWEEYVTGLADETCRPDSWPPFLLLAVAREDGWSWLWACDHAFTDSVAQLMVPAELATAYVAERGEPSADLPAAGSFLDHAAAERERAAGFGLESREVRSWLEILGRHDYRLPRFPLDLGLPPGATAPVVLCESDALIGDEVAAFDALCRDAGARFLSGVLAALALSERRLAKVDRYLGAIVLDTRADDTRMSHGSFCTFAPVDLPVGEEPFTETVAAAEAAYATAKGLAAMPVHVALGALLMNGLATMGQLDRPQLVSYLDLRRIPGAGTEAYDRGIHFAGVGRTDNAWLRISREEGRLHLAALCPDTREAQEAVGTYLAAVREALLEALDQGAADVRRDR